MLHSQGGLLKEAPGATDTAHSKQLAQVYQVRSNTPGQRCSDGHRKSSMHLSLNISRQVLMSEGQKAVLPCAALLAEMSIRRPIYGRLRQ